MNVRLSTNSLPSVRMKKEGRKEGGQTLLETGFVGAVFRVRQSVGLPSFLYDFVLQLHTVSVIKDTVKLPIFLFLKCYQVSQKLGLRQG